MSKMRQQIAAMPLRWHKDRVQVLMVTSRDTGRWIVPKGWTMKNVKPWNAAAIEALEEAGVKGTIGQEMFGLYQYDKGLGNGRKVRCEVQVYPMIVEKLKSDWKEREERTRKWFYVGKAAKLVDEPDLADLLRSLAQKPKKVPIVGPMLKKAAD